MDKATFETRKQFLKQFYDIDRVNFLCSQEIEIRNFFEFNSTSVRVNDDYTFEFETEANINKPHEIDGINISFKNLIKLLKPFVYFLYSINYHEKYLKDNFLYPHNIEMVFFPVENKEFILRNNFYFPSNQNFLKFFKIESQLNNLNIKIDSLKIILTTRYFNINKTQYLKFGGTITSQIIESETSTYKSAIKEELCCICFVNKPNILYFDCYHFSTCDDCDQKGKFKSVCCVEQ